jgi:hypothetical protein
MSPGSCLFGEASITKRPRNMSTNRNVHARRAAR